VRLAFICAAILGMACSGAIASDAAGSALRGKLVQQTGKAFIDTADHKHVSLSADELTTKILLDARLNNSDFEVRGHFTTPDHFDVDPFEKRPAYIYVDGKRKVVSYWCDVCYIRTYSPGKCWCCQKYTDLDPQDPDAQ
jgi:hypothetical protein